MRFAGHHLLDSFHKVIHHFEVLALHLLAVGHCRQKVVQDRHEEVHDHDYHREQVDDEEQPNRLVFVSNHRC